MDFKVFQMTAFLEKENNRQLFIHRLSTASIFPGLEVGASEAMMVSEIIHPLYYLPLSFWPYYLSTKIIGMDSIYNDYTDHYIGLDFYYTFPNSDMRHTHASLMLELDFSYTFPNRARIYGELLVDEYPFRWWHKNPDKRAHLLGVYYPLTPELEFRAELQQCL